MIENAKNKFQNFKDKPFRPSQAEAIQAIRDSKKKVVAVCAPTGTGKSLIGMGAGATHDKFAYLCSSKQLQQQLREDFPEALLMMGRGNFPCNVDEGNRTADMCIHTSTTPCQLRPVCHYKQHKDAVVNHDMQILNYWYLLNEGNYVGRFSDYPVVICDEADTLESLLTSFVELRLSMSQLKSLDIQPPKYKTTTACKGLESWQDWASTEAYLKITNRVKQLEGHVSSINPNASMSVQEACLVRELTQFKRLQAKLQTFSNHVDESWIFQETAGNRENGWKFQPTWLTPELSDEYFFRHGEQFVLMSATLLPKPILAQTLGLSSNEVEVIELPSTFPLSNRPVLLDPVADMSHKTFAAEMPSLLAEIKRLVDKHRGNKGVIHTVSYKLNQIVMSLKNRRFITHNSRDKDIALKRFADSKDGILVSPSSTRGVDLPDDECRFIIIAKAPFQSLGDKLVKSRVYGTGGLGTFWYRANCAQDIVQASGRGVRHKDDHCTTYVLDKQACGLIVDNQSLFPRYWMEAVDYI